ncbi:hypothetical protein Fot_17654 [Forsythia ovata]|uniref:Uncharacterized protein n=1 Tax=Forsythia ovata TaxID=205694 RepID=A0ABD1VG31_9LAMI
MGGWEFGEERNWARERLGEEGGVGSARSAVGTISLAHCEQENGTHCYIGNENEEQLNIFDYTQNFTTYQVNLKSNCPIPPVACNWYKYKDDIASGWERLYKAQIDVFKKMIGTDIATQEIINLSSP